MTKWYDKSVEELHDLLVKKEITATELTKETFNRLKETEPKIDAFLALNEEKALEQAKLIDEKGIAAEDVLAGISFFLSHRLSSPKITGLATGLDSVNHRTSKIFSQLTKGEKLNYDFEILNT